MEGTSECMLPYSCPRRALTAPLAFHFGKLGNESSEEFEITFSKTKELSSFLSSAISVALGRKFSQVDVIERSLYHW
jgi:hypothetical protein